MMHLLAAAKGSLCETDEAVDLAQSGGDIVFLSAADTELASISGALSALQRPDCRVRVANLMQLSHPMSVDVYTDHTIAKSRLVVVRILGGESYWAYGLEKLYACALEYEIQLAVLPGDDKPDPNLFRFCTIAENNCQQLWRYLVEGGPKNISNFLIFCLALLDEASLPPPAIPLLKAGLFWPGKGSGQKVISLGEIADFWLEGAPTIAICFYRALIQSGGLAPVEALVRALERHHLNALPVYLSSLKDSLSVDIIRSIFAEYPPDLVINLTGFAVSSLTGTHHSTILDERGAIVLQAVLAAGSLERWRQSTQGLMARDLAMHVVLPEVDGRIFTRAIAFKNASYYDERLEANIAVHEANHDRIDYVASLAAAWVRLRRTPESQRKVALILANYPNKDGRIGNGVGLDTPAGTIEVLKAMKRTGYGINHIPVDGNRLIEQLQGGATNAFDKKRTVQHWLKLSDYLTFFNALPQAVRHEITKRWGSPQSDPHFYNEQGGFAIAALSLGNVVCGIQPARGYNIDPKETYHSPDLVPPHSYLAFYAWVRNRFDADAMIHMGKHGNLEWLPGKALSLSSECYPEVLMGDLPHIYPFIVNDPGEGSQAKRRACAVIIDHLTPPLTRAESYGPLRDLEALVDEYYQASGMDQRRVQLLRKQIFDQIGDIGLDVDAGITAHDDEDEGLYKLDAYLCDLKEMQIRDGLHIFGCSPQGRLRDDLITALVRVPRGLGKEGDASLQRAIAEDLELNDFDPLDCDMAARWEGPRPKILTSLLAEPWRNHGDLVERIELLASQLVSGTREPPPHWVHSLPVLAAIKKTIRPAVEDCGPCELSNLMRALDGHFVIPGPSGAPTRGRLDVLPTGRNFFSLDARLVPTPAAWKLGQKSAELLIIRYRQDHGEWPISFGLTAWGTSNMRTGGDDIAQAMALIGAKPVWDHTSGRVIAYEIIPLASLARPRVDVTLRISGFFRDAFPQQIALFDAAVRAISILDEPAEENPLAAQINAKTSELIASGSSEPQARLQAGFRVFGSKPGAYGAGLQALMDEAGWEDRRELAESFIQWGGYAYGAEREGQAEHDLFTERLGTLQAVIHNQDNREHDLLDSDDYYQFEGGMTAAAEYVSSSRPNVYHNDHSRPERPVIRSLEEEIARVIRGRAVNPKWIAGVMRHGYKGAFEIGATVDYLFAFAATTGAVRHHHFEAVYEAYLGDESVRDFLQQNNPSVLKEIAKRFMEAMDRNLWKPRSNSAKLDLSHLIL